MPEEFALADVLRHRDSLERTFPNNRFIDAKIRQSLQVLRDQQVLKFLGKGHYQRLNVAPIFSPLVDFSKSDMFSSLAQAARVVLETWASLNLYCLNCESDGLDPLPDNTPVADFECALCSSRYQLKAKNGRFGPRISGAAYGPMIAAARARTLPEHILVEYDSRFATVVFVDAIAGRSITADRVIARKPLSDNARRAGWQGCTIDVLGLPRIRLVGPAGLERLAVRREWKALGDA